MSCIFVAFYRLKKILTVLQWSVVGLSPTLVTPLLAGAPFYHQTYFFLTNKCQKIHLWTFFYLSRTCGTNQYSIVFIEWHTSSFAIFTFSFFLCMMNWSFDITRSNRLKVINFIYSFFSTYKCHNYFSYWIHMIGRKVHMNKQNYRGKLIFFIMQN